MIATDFVGDVLTTPDGRRLGYLVRGPLNGRPVMYLHGAPGSRLEQFFTMPDEVLDRFGLRVVSIDRPGYGETDPRSDGRPGQAEDVLAVADIFGIRTFTVVGISSGGSKALTLAALAPDRVERVVLCCAQMPYDDDEAVVDLQPSQASGIAYLRSGRSELIEQACEQTRAAALNDPVAAFADGTATLSDREHAWYAMPWVRDAFVTDIREAFRVSSEGYIGDALNNVQPFEVDVSTIRCPVRAIHGSQDDWEPIANLRRIFALIADTQIFVLDGMNHFGSIMYPDLTASLCVG